TLSGGWNSDFTSQTGASTIDGEYGISGTNKNNNGILITGGPVTVDRFVIQNSTSADSGGIYLLANLTLTNSTIRNNHASNRGAGIFIYNGGSLTLTNSTISGNTNSASGLGAGIYAYAGSVTIQNSTIVYNTATSGQGGGISLNSGTTVVMRNSIVANNTAGGGNPDCSGTIGTSDHNIFGNSSGCVLSNSLGDQLDIDPQLNNTLSGTPPVYVPQLGGPAIDAGTATGCPSTDEQGQSRPADGDGDSIAVCDIGAYEVHPIIGVPVHIAVSSGDNQQKPMGQAYDTPLAVEITDGLGDPVANVSVTFTAPASGASGAFASTDSESETVATDISGIATSSIFTANNALGAYTVVASTGSLSVSFSLQNLYIPGVPTSLVVISGNNQSAKINTAFSSVLQVRVLDGYNNPVSGVGVTFTGPVSGASGAFSSSSSFTETVATDTGGYASSSVWTANSSRGQYLVSVSTAGLASVNFTLTNIAAWYVDASMLDDSNTCDLPAVACKTINGVLGKVGFQAGDVIYVAIGTYTGSSSDPVITISKRANISGGWDSAFTTQNGFSTIDGQNARPGVKIMSSANVIMDHFIIEKGLNYWGGAGIQVTSSTLTLNTSVVQNNVAGGIGTSVGGGLGAYSSTVTINNSAIDNNEMWGNLAGGGISSVYSNLTLSNTTMTGNYSTNGAGAIYL